MAEPGSDLLFGAFRLDRKDERLWGPHGPVKLGNKAYQVLLRLAEQGGRLLTKDALFASVWDGTTVSESALTSVVKELRRALGDESRTPVYIESVYGRGYRLLPQVSTSSSPSPAAPPALPLPAASPFGAQPLLHVAAFDDSAIRDSQPHLAAVLREEILFALSRFHDIRLVSEMDAPPTGTGYGERDYQLSVRLLHDGSAPRAFARIARLSSHSIIWAETVELSAADPGRGVEQLVRMIAAAALARLHDDVLHDLPQQASDAYTIYFRNKLRMRSQDSLAEAREIAADWERLIQRHPEFGHAYPPLIRLYNTDYCYTGLGATGARERTRAYELAGKAVAIDPAEAHFHTVKGWCHIRAGEAPLAREHLEEALRLNPYNQNRLVELATAFMFLDDLDRAQRLVDQCRALAPSAAGAPHEEQGLLHLLRREYASAADCLARATRHHPDDGIVSSRTIMSGLYALLAAAGAGAPDVASRARSWWAAADKRWCGPQPLDRQSLIAWVTYNHPLQSPAQRRWLLDLLEPALSLADPANTLVPAPMPAETAY